MDTTRDPLSMSALSTVPPQKKPPRWLSALLKNPITITGTVLVILFAVVAILAPVIAPPSFASQPYEIPRDGFLAEPQPPSTS
jgi:peptide/nickel transport system permease protein